MPRKKLSSLGKDSIHSKNEHQKARQLAEELRMEEFRAKEGNKPLTQAEFEEWKKGRLIG